MTYPGSIPALLFDFYFGGSDDARVLLAGENRQVHLGRAPSLMAENAACGRSGRHVADELDDVRVLRGRLGERALDTVDNGLQRDVARDGVTALIVQLADGGADLVVGVAGDVLH